MKRKYVKPELEELFVTAKGDVNCNVGFSVFPVDCNSGTSVAP